MIYYNRPPPGARIWMVMQRVIVVDDHHPSPVAIPPRAYFGAEEVWCQDMALDMGTGAAGWYSLAEAPGSHLDVEGYTLERGGWRLTRPGEAPHGTIMAAQRVCWTPGQVWYRFWMQGPMPQGGWTGV